MAKAEADLAEQARIAAERQAREAALAAEMEEMDKKARQMARDAENERLRLQEIQDAAKLKE